jgi:sugar lactone lactonase YvrE
MSYFVASLSARIFRPVALLGVILSICVGMRGQTLAFNPGFVGSVAGGGTDASGTYAGDANGAKLGSPQRVAFDRIGNLYLVEAASRVVRVVASGKGPIPSLPTVADPVAGDLYTVAGNFYEPYGLTVDSRGNVFIADRADDAVKVVYAGGTIANLPASPVIGVVYPVAGISGFPGNDGDGASALSARLDQPSGVTVDLKGNIYIADTANNRIRVVYAGGAAPGIPRGAIVGSIYTIAGSWANSCSSQMNASYACGDGSLATASELNSPDSVAVDASGNVYVSDAGDSRVRAIYAEGSIPGVQSPVAGDIYTIAGTGAPGLGADGVPATTAQLSQRIGQVAIDPAGDIYIPDAGNNVIRKVDPLGTITTVFGGYASTCLTATNTYGDGCASNAATLANPTGVALDAAANLYVADNGHNLVRTVMVNVSALSFNGPLGVTATEGLSVTNTSTVPLVLNGIDVNGPFPQVSGNGPSQDCAGSLRLDSGRSCQIALTFTPVETTTTSGSVTVTSNATNADNSKTRVTLTGSGTHALNAIASPALAVKTLAAVPTSGVAHPRPNATPAAAIVPGVPTTPGYIATVAGNNASGYVNGSVGGLATATSIDTATSVALDSAGNLYIADTQADIGTGGVVLSVNAQSGILNLVAGGGSNTPTNGASPLNVALQTPAGIALDGSNNLYLADSLDNVIEKVSADGTTLTIVAGIVGEHTGDALGHVSGDNGPATSATLGSSVNGVFVDNTGNIYIADTGNNAIRKVDTSGTIRTVAGTLGTQCASGGCGDGGPATSAQLNTPSSVFVDKSGNIFIVDSNNFRVRMVYESGAAAACLVALENPSAFSLGGATTCSGSTIPTPSPAPVVGNIYPIAGSSVACATSSSLCGSGGLATAAGLALPNGLTLDGGGNLFISDGILDVVRKVDAQTGLISDIAGTIRSTGFSGDGAAATAALLNGPAGLSIDSAGNLFIADTYNYVVRAIAGAGVLPLTGQTITFNPLPNVTYGVAPITLTATSDSGLPITYTVTGPATVSGAQLTITGATASGTPVMVTASQPGDATHSAATPVSQSFTVAQATITVTATNVSQPFGTTLPPSLPYTVQCSCGTGSGLVGSDTLTGSPSLTTAYTTTSALGTSFPINIAQGSLAVSPPGSVGNYTFVLVPGTLTVGGNAAQTITFPSLPATISYGDNPIALAATSSAGLPVSYTATGSAIVTGSVATGWKLTIVSAGAGSVTASQAGNSQYAAATPATQAFSVKQATLTITATNISQSFGTALPSPLPYTISGLVGTDTTGGAPTLTTAYTQTSAVGVTFPITVTQGTLAILPPALPGNYTINLVAGTLTVTSATNTIAFPTIPNTTYGSSVALAAKASSGLPVTYTVVSGPAIVNGSALAITGVGTVTVTANQAGNANVAAATPVTQSFAAIQATLLVTANNATRAFGATNPVFTYQIGGFVNGDGNSAAVLTGTPLITTTATPSAPVGMYPIVPSVGTLLSANYNFTFANATLTVTGAPSYIITANPATLTVQRGQSAQTTIQLTPVNNYQGTVALSCGSLPVGVTCTFSPAALTLALVGNGISTQAVLGTLTVSATGPSAQLKPLIPGNAPPVFATVIFFVPGVLTGLIAAFNRKRLARHKKTQGLLLLLILFAGMMGLGACAGGGSKSNEAQPGTTTVALTATATGASGTGSPNTTSFLNLTINIVQ